MDVVLNSVCRKNPLASPALSLGSNTNIFSRQSFQSFIFQGRHSYTLFFFQHIMHVCLTLPWHFLHSFSHLPHINNWCMCTFTLMIPTGKQWVAGGLYTVAVFLSYSTVYFVWEAVAAGGYSTLIGHLLSSLIRVRLPLQPVPVLHVRRWHIVMWKPCTRLVESQHYVCHLAAFAAEESLVEPRVHDISDMDDSREKPSQFRPNMEKHDWIYINRSRPKRKYPNLLYRPESCDCMSRSGDLDLAETFLMNKT